MAVAFVQEFDVDPGGDRSTTNYDAVASRLGGVRPEGRLIHTAGFDVWESREQGQRFILEQACPSSTSSWRASRKALSARHGGTRSTSCTK